MKKTKTTSSFGNSIYQDWLVQKRWCEQKEHAALMLYQLHSKYMVDINCMAKFNIFKIKKKTLECLIESKKLKIKLWKTLPQGYIQKVKT